jgi:hypothetical protein
MEAGAGPALAHDYGIWFVTALAAYLPCVLYVAKRVREGKLVVPKFALRIALFVYNAVAGFFSAWGFWLLIQDPKIMAPTAWYPEASFPPNTRLVIVIFCSTKAFEFVDTFLHSALKGKDPTFLHAFHHIATSLVSWYAIATNCHFQHNPVVMNLFVHAVMFTYFALVEIHPMIKAGLRPFRIFITAIQVLQMFVGTYNQAFVLFTSGVYGSDLSNDAAQTNVAIFGLCMYAVYILMFGNFFVQEFVVKKPKGEKSAEGKRK